MTISGSSSQSYAASLILTVLDHNGCGPTPADSRFDWLYGATPTNTGPRPSIPDPITVGDQLSCSTGGWTGDLNYPSITYTYEWRRVNADATTTTVGSAQTYVPTPEDGGLQLECVVSATNRFGSTQTISDSVRVRSPPKNIRPPEVLHIGPIAPGIQLGCDTGAWVGAATLAYSYTWISHRSDGDHTVSSADTYTPSSDDIGATISCSVTASNQDGTATATSTTVSVLRPAHLTFTVIRKGWRSTGNVLWMAHGGPVDQATPQAAFAIGPDSDPVNEAGLTEVTVTNSGDLPSPADKALQVEHGRSATPLKVPSLKPGQSFTTTVPFTALYPEDVYGRPTPNDGCTNVSPTRGVTHAPLGTIAERSAISIGGSIVLPPELPPTADVEVDIGVVERRKAAKIMRARQITCHWVAGRSGAVRGVRSTTGFCDTPIWIRAAVHGRRWSMRFTHPLPHGRDVVYARALGPSGVFDPGFTTRAHNRRALNVP